MNYETIPAFEELLEDTKTYVETNVDLLKLKFVDKTSVVTSSLISIVAISALILITVVLASIGIAIWIGKMLGEYYYGFYIVSGFFTILIIIIYLFREKWLKKPIANSLIENMS
jgi:hypothetical protein